MEAVLMEVKFNRRFPGLGQRIREKRISSNQPLAQLAAKAGISVPHWNRIENEKVKELPEETLRRIEKALESDLGVSFEEALAS